MARSISEFCQRWVGPPAGSKRSWRTAVSMSESSIEMFSFQSHHVSMRVESHSGGSLVGRDVDLAVGIDLQQPTAVGILIRYLDITYRGIGVVVGCPVWQQLNGCANGGTGEVGFVNDAQGAGWDTAAATRQCKGLGRVGGNGSGVDLAVAGDEHNPARRG